MTASSSPVAFRGLAARALAGIIPGYPRAGREAGILRPALPHWTRAQRSWLADPDAATVTSVGLTAPTVLGAATKSAATNRHMIAYTSAGASGDKAGLISPAFTVVRRAYSPTLVTAFRTQGSIADLRIWVGFFGADPTGSTTAPANTAALCYGTDSHGTSFWRTVTSDATTPLVNPATAPIASGTEYVSRIEMDGSRVEFWLNDVLIGEHTANLPVANTLIGIGATVTALAASAKGLRWAWTQLWQN